MVEFGLSMPAPGGEFVPTGFRKQFTTTMEFDRAGQLKATEKFVLRGDTLAEDIRREREEFMRDMAGTAARRHAQDEEDKRDPAGAATRRRERRRRS
jgi:hypothetical protein